MNKQPVIVCSNNEQVEIAALSLINACPYGQSESFSKTFNPRKNNIFVVYIGAGGWLFNCYVELNLLRNEYRAIEQCYDFFTIKTEYTEINDELKLAIQLGMNILNPKSLDDVISDLIKEN